MRRPHSLPVESRATRPHSPTLGECGECELVPHSPHSPTLGECDLGRTKKKVRIRKPKLNYIRKTPPAIDCILGQGSQVWIPHGSPPLASVLADADIAPEPSRVV